MSNQKKRIALTVPDDVDNVLERLSVLTKAPKTKLIMEMLQEYLPILERTADALEQIIADKKMAKILPRNSLVKCYLMGMKIRAMATEVKAFNASK